VKATRNSFEELHSNLNTHVRNTRDSLSDVNRQLLEKYSADEIHRLTDNKLTVSEFRTSVDELYKLLESKTSVDEFRANVGDQQLINETLCAENCVARWIWKSGSVRSGHSIPWDVQSVNTCPENFVWERDVDGTSILCIMPGLYEVSFAFFSRTRPIVNLIVNGDNVLIPDHKENCNLSGYSVVEFITLPERARIVMSYAGDTDSEGFLNLKKL
jgi:hypothetical protein